MPLIEKVLLIIVIRSCYGQGVQVTIKMERFHTLDQPFWRHGQKGRRESKNRCQMAVEADSGLMTLSSDFWWTSVKEGAVSQSIPAWWPQLEKNPSFSESLATLIPTLFRQIPRWKSQRKRTYAQSSDRYVADNWSNHRKPVGFCSLSFIFPKLKGNLWKHSKFYPAYLFLCRFLPHADGPSLATF